MSQSLSKINLHLVFSTKDRKPLISEDNLPRLHGYLATLCHELGSFVFRVGGTSDHVHIACTLPKAISTSSLLEGVKKKSSKWMKTACSSDFNWQAGYAAFSISESQLPRVIKYIDEQRDHHQRINYKEEVVKFLKVYKLDYNEKYLWN